MAIGDKKPVVMESDRAVPGGVATLGEDGKLDGAQRPDYSIGQVTGLQAALDGKQDTLSFDAEPAEGSPNPVKSGGVYDALAKKQPTLAGNPGQLIGIDNGGTARATVYPTNEQLLDNAYWAKKESIINQRGISSVFSEQGSYFIDRWVLVSGSVEITSGGLKLNGTIEQRFEHSLEGAVTATVLSTSGLVDAVYDATGKKMQITANGNILLAAKLELGPVQTLAHKEGDNWVLNDPPPNKALELAKCQRYQLVAVGNLASGYCSKDGQIRLFISTPAPMRANPTVTIAYENNFIINGRVMSIAKFNLVQNGILKKNGVLINFTSDEVFDTYYPVVNVDSSFTFDANL